MKRILLFTLSTFCFGAFAQNDVAITVTSPPAGSTVGPGQAFNFDVTITNTGSVAITPSDTIVYLPLLNGSNTLVSGNPPQTIVYFITGISIAANGGTTTETHSFTGLNISGASAMQIDFCAYLGAVFGPNWTGVNETDTMNNLSCNTVNYNPGTVGIDENAISGKIKLNVSDKSYFANGFYNLDVANLGNGTAQVSVLNITGQKVYSIAKDVSNHKLKGEMDLRSLGNGIYIVSIAVDGKAVSARKIMVQ